MDRDQTLALFAEGKDAWNEWAHDKLAERHRLEQSGAWSNTETRSTWEFSATADYSNANRPYTFDNAASFDSFVFPWNAWFENSTFEGLALFSGARFHGQVEFSNAMFKGEAWFTDTVLCNRDHPANFSYANFDSHTFFEGAAFKGSTFYRATFNKEVSFCKVTFEKHVNFISATFKDRAFFSPIKLRDSYPTTIFNGSASFSQATFEEFTRFAEAQFNGRANFHAIHAKRGFSLANAKFLQVPDFIQAHFEEAPRLDNIDVKRWHPRLQDRISQLYGRDPENDLHDIPARWRALKRLAIQDHDHERELLFFSMEISSARFVTDWPVSLLFWRQNSVRNAGRFWLGKFYWLTSNFGRSVALPLFWLYVVITLFAAVYLSESRTANHQPRASLSETLSDVLRQPIARTTKLRASAPCTNKRGNNLDSLDQSLFARTDAISESWQLAITNGVWLGVLGEPENTRRIFGCLFGFVRDGNGNPLPIAPVVPRTVSRWLLLQKTLSLIFIFLIGLGIRNMLKMK